MSHLCSSFLIASICAHWCAGQTANVPPRISLTLERLGPSGWAIVPPGLVCHQSDRLRFRVETSFPGALYVIDYGTSGRNTMLFPGETAGTDNRLEAGASKTIPAASATFRVDGPPGYDMIYWMVWPLGRSAADRTPPPIPEPSPSAVPSAATIHPRCDDALLRARGDCIDLRAGPQSSNSTAQLPPGLAAIPELKPRDLVILNDKDRALISLPNESGGWITYVFRLAHD